MTKSSIAYVSCIELENIRGFKKLHIDLGTSNGQRMVTVLIGRNGTCKTTLLRCIAIALCHESDAAVLLAEFGGRLVCEDAESGSIKTTLADIYGSKIGDIQINIEHRKGRDTIVEHKNSLPVEDFFVCGYGPNRGNTGTLVSRSYRVLDSVATLFDYRRSLVDVELMLRRVEDYMGSERYERAQRGIKHVLGLTAEHSIQYVRGGGVRISGPGIGKDIPLEGWADGYRMTFNWLIDLYGWAVQADAITQSGGIRGILLIDEIDQNLHPELQSRLISELREALPEIQIFATTHSPLTALGTESQNLVSLHRKEDCIEPVTVPSLTGYSADDALLEEALFGTDPYPIHTRRKLDRYRELVTNSSAVRSVVKESEMRGLVEELSPGNLPGLRGKDDRVLEKLEQIAQLLKKKKD